MGVFFEEAGPVPTGVLTPIILSEPQHTPESRQSEDSYPHFTEKKTEAQRREMTYPVFKDPKAGPQTQTSSRPSPRLGRWIAVIWDHACLQWLHSGHTPRGHTPGGICRQMHLPQALAQLVMS